MFDWIEIFIERTGYLGIAILMLAENLVPPIPSELIMPLAGFAAARGGLDIFWVVVSGTVGSVLGTLAWYLLGLYIGFERLCRFAARHGRWLTLTPADVEQARAFFIRWGAVGVLAGRLVPTLRTFISVPAGFARMGLVQFLTLSTLGTAIWTGFLAGMGFLMQERYQLVQSWVNPVSNVVGIGLLALYLYRVVIFRRGRKKSDQSGE